MKINNRYKFLWLILSIGLCFAFTTKGTNYKVYYFPFQKFTSPQVYAYKNDQNNELQYWKMRYSKKQRLLNTQVYDNDFALLESTYESCTESGASFKQYELYFKEKKYIAALGESDVFQWGENLKDTLVWNIEYTFGNEVTTVKKERVLFKNLTTYQFNGKIKDAIILKDTYTTVKELYKETTSSSFTQYTTYAKNIGIVSYERFYEDGKSIKYSLDGIRND